MPTLTLKKGREKSLRRLHPWIFDGAVKSTTGRPKFGETVDVVAADGRWLARAGYSPESKIVARVWTFDQSEAIDPAFFNKALLRCVAARRSPGLMIPEKACRLVNAESDGLPGVVIDRYGDWLSCEFTSAAADFWKFEIAKQLMEITGCAGVWNRSEGDVRTKEGLLPESGLLLGDEPPDLIEINESPARFLVDVRTGHKTGYYLDQRDNRRMVAQHCQSRTVLNCFSYTGGFGIAALLGGASQCTNIDTSGPALAMARRNATLNGFEDRDVDYLEDDVFKALRRFREEGRTFDVIVLDPPKFVDSRATLQKACRGYKDINLSALRLLEPGGLLFTFSCSGLMNEDLFQKVVAGAALDSGRDARIVQRVSQAPDHPVALTFPEGQYLKGLLVQAL